MKRSSVTAFAVFPVLAVIAIGLVYFSRSSGPPATTKGGSAGSSNGSREAEETHRETAKSSGRRGYEKAHEKVQARAKDFEALRREFFNQRKDVAEAYETWRSYSDWKSASAPAESKASIWWDSQRNAKVIAERRELNHALLMDELAISLQDPKTRSWITQLVASKSFASPEAEKRRQELWSGDRPNSDYPPMEIFEEALAGQMPGKTPSDPHGTTAGSGAVPDYVVEHLRNKIQVSLLTRAAKYYYENNLSAEVVEAENAYKEAQNEVFELMNSPQRHEIKTNP